MNGHCVAISSGNFEAVEAIAITAVNAAGLRLDN